MEEAVFVAEADGVGVAVKAIVGVLVRVAVAVRVNVGVKVSVRVSVTVGVWVLVKVAVAVMVLVGVKVKVGVLPPEQLGVGVKFKLAIHWETGAPAQEVVRGQMRAINERPSGSRVKMSRGRPRTVHPSDDSVVIGSPIIFIGAIVGRIGAEFLDQNRMTRLDHHVHIGVPSAGIHLRGGVGV